MDTDYIGKHRATDKAAWARCIIRERRGDIYTPRHLSPTKQVTA